MAEGQGETGSIDPAAYSTSGTASAALATKIENLSDLERIVEDSRGPRQVIVVTNSGDSELVGNYLEPLASKIFCADGTVEVSLVEEPTRRGQFLGLLDALRQVQGAGRLLDADGVALGIVLPGQGTRLSPITQRLYGIKPFMPVLIRTSHPGVWLNSAAASLYSWTLVTHHLRRMGFRGVAWKWGDEPQFASRRLSQLNVDLTNADAVRFGATAAITDDLAEHKDWLLADPDTADLIGQVRRRPRTELAQCLDRASRDRPARTLVHIGSPAFSHIFLDEAEAVFGGMPGAIDVDGYLFDALTYDADAWQAEVRRDAALQELLADKPDFYHQVQQLKQRIEARRGRPLIIKVISFGEHIYWGDIGQLAKVRHAFWAVAAATEEGAFARRLAKLDDVPPDRFGNRLAGDTVLPDDGSVRNSVLIDTKIHRSAEVDGAVLVSCQLSSAQVRPGSVAYGCTVGDLELGAQSFAFNSIAGRLNVPAYHTHTSIPADPNDLTQGLQDWLADTREDPGSGSNYTEPQLANRASFAAKFEQMRERQVTPDQLERAIDERFRRQILAQLR